MTYEFTRDLITEPQTVVEGMCLADYDQIPGFWELLDQPDKLADLIVPRALTAKRQSLTIERPGDSPNQGGFGVLIALPALLIIIHWWGRPVGQKHDGIVAWLKNVASQVSAHFVVSAGRVTQILPLTSPSWANGNAWANTHAITIEADPNNIEGTIRTIIELIRTLIARGEVSRQLTIGGHRDYYSTECPGSYYPHLSEIRQAALSEEDEDMALSDDDIQKLVKAIWGPGGGGNAQMYTDRLTGNAEYPETQLFSQTERVEKRWWWPTWNLLKAFRQEVNEKLDKILIALEKLLTKQAGGPDSDETGRAYDAEITFKSRKDNQ